MPYTLPALPYATTALGAAGMANQVESHTASSVLWAVAGFLGLSFVVLAARQHLRHRR